MRTKQERKLDEKRVYDRRHRDDPKYYQKYPNKTPGKACSNPRCCGNPRRESSHHKSRITLQEKKFYAANDDIDEQIEVAKWIEEEMSYVEGGFWEEATKGHGRTYHAVGLSARLFNETYPCQCPMCWDVENEECMECEGPINKIKVA